jgi:hypothetical protein
MDTAHHVEVTCNSYLRWVVDVCGPDLAGTVLQSMADYLTTSQGGPSDPMRRNALTFDS